MTIADQLEDTDHMEAAQIGADLYHAAKREPRIVDAFIAFCNADVAVAEELEAIQRGEADQYEANLAIERWQITIEDLAALLTGGLRQRFLDHAQSMVTRASVVAEVGGTVPPRSAVGEA